MESGLGTSELSCPFADKNARKRRGKIRGISTADWLSVNQKEYAYVLTISKTEGM